MSETGFANNPTEWWHFSHGDQLWAKLGGHSAPLCDYGVGEPDGAVGAAGLVGTAVAAVVRFIPTILMAAAPFPRAVL